ncbi:MAG: iron-containing alcohol dehydrogenase [Candidatus Aenigmatarchaeota archaeon]
MDPHQIELSREVIIGNEAFSQIPEILEKLQLKGPALLISGPSTFKAAGGEVKEILEEQGFGVEVNISSEVTRENLNQIIESSRDFRFVLGVGGGRTIDTAKYVSKERNTPYISVPTAPSHDGIASSRATINGQNRKHSYEANAPLAVVADLEVLRNAPYRLISAGCGDLISNITAVEDWKLGASDNGEYYSDYAAALSVLAAEIVISSADMIQRKEERGMRNLVKGLISGSIAMSIAGSSRPCSGADHQFSHALDAIAEKPDLHGHQCAMGALLSAEMHDMDYQRLKEAMETVGMPTTVDGMSFTKDEAFRAWEEAGEIRDRYTILDKKQENTQDLFKKVGII